MHTTVKLHGWVGKKYGKTHKFAVHTPAQAVSLLKANFKDFAKDIVSYNGGYRVHVGKESIGVGELRNTNGNKTIHIIPVVSGSGKGLGQIIVGALLIYIALNTGYFAGAEAGTLTAAGNAMVSFGGSLILGGVMQMIAPTVSTQQFSSESPENRPSYLFNGPVNTTGQGNPVSILYGKLMIGSQVISAGLSTRQL